MFLFCFAISSMNEFAAALSASILFVLSPLPMRSSIEPEASSTSTISSGCATVDFKFDVDESAENAVRKSASGLFLIVIVPSAPVSSMPSVDTVLSVQMRPTLWVE